MAAGACTRCSRALTAAWHAVPVGTDEPARLRVEVLGPLRLVVDGGPVEVRGSKRRAVLALLAFAEGRTVTVDQLVRRAVAGRGARNRRGRPCTA